MSYTKTTWIDGSGEIISAVHLNNIEDGIFDNDAATTLLDTDKIEEDDYATQALGGTVKAVLVGTVLYMSNDGTDPVPVP